ncbi:MAG: GNAT family N-acetyltransferase [Chlamydiota bacterium]
MDPLKKTYPSSPFDCPVYAKRIKHYFIVFLISIFSRLLFGLKAHSGLTDIFLLAGCLGSVCLNAHTSISQEFVFETPASATSEFLVNFAIESNDIYQTRTASIKIARAVFEIVDSVFEKGVVSTLKANGEIVGFYTLKVNDQASDVSFEHELGHLFVKAGLQNQGFGTRLFHHAISTARAKGWKKLEWLCDPDAEVFYSKMGATVKTHCENLLNPSVDLPIFEYSL